MWTSKILNSNYTGDTLIVTVEYTNGTKTVSEPVDMTGGSKETLDRKISAKLASLEATEALNAQIGTGDYTPVTYPEDPEITFRRAVRKAEEVKKLQDLGIVDAPTSKDPLADAVQEAKDAYDPSFITKI